MFNFHRLTASMFKIWLFTPGGKKAKGLGGVYRLLSYGIIHTVLVIIPYINTHTLVRIPYGHLHRVTWMIPTPPAYSPGSVSVTGSRAALTPTAKGY